MKLKKLFTPAAMALAITIATVPALAQSGENEVQRRSADRAARATGSGDQGRAARGDVAVRRSTPRDDSRGGNRAEARSRPSEDRTSSVRPNDNRPSDNRASSARPNNNRPSDNRASSARPNNNRPSDNRGSNAWQNNNRPSDNRASGARQDYNRGYDARRNDNRGYDSRRDYGRQYTNRDYGWRGSYDRNAWRSRVRFGLGISIFAGSPFRFHFDYGWRPGFNYRYPIRQGMVYGGMSFLLDPDYAEVYIDGNFVGTARDFGGQPVPVAVGYHRIELYAPGFEPVAFDINVYPGQVIPYRGSLYRVY